MNWGNDVYRGDGVVDRWMIEYMEERGRLEVPGYDSDEGQKAPNCSSHHAFPTTNTKPASLWRRPTRNAAGEEPSTAKDHSTPRLALVHQEKGGLFCKYGGHTMKADNEKHRYKWFFAESGRKNTLEYSVAVTLRTKSLESQTAVIDLKRMCRNGAPERTGAAILLSVVDQLDGIADELLIKNPPNAFVHLVHKEQWVEKTRTGYRIETQDLKRFLEGRLELAQ